jgi:hypothetical protein
MNSSTEQALNGHIRQPKHLRRNVNPDEVGFRTTTTAA